MFGLLFTNNLNPDFRDSEMPGRNLNCVCFTSSPNGLESFPADSPAGKSDSVKKTLACCVNNHGLVSYPGKCPVHVALKNGLIKGNHERVRLLSFTSGVCLSGLWTHSKAGTHLVNYFTLIARRVLCLLYPGGKT